MILNEIKNEEVKMILSKEYDEQDDIELDEILNIEFDIACENNKTEFIETYLTDEDLYRNTKKMWNILDEYNEYLYDSNETADKFYSDQLNDAIIYIDGGIYDGEFISEDNFKPNLCTVSIEDIKKALDFINENDLSIYDCIITTNLSSYSQWCGNSNKYKIEVNDTVGYWNGIDDIEIILKETLEMQKELGEQSCNIQNR